MLPVDHTYPHSEAVDEDNDDWDNEKKNDSIDCFWGSQVSSYSGSESGEGNSVSEPRWYYSTKARVECAHHSKALNNVTTKSLSGERTSMLCPPS